MMSSDRPRSKLRPPSTAQDGGNQSSFRFPEESSNRPAPQLSPMSSDCHPSIQMPPSSIPVSLNGTHRRKRSSKNGDVASSARSGRRRGDGTSNAPVTRSLKLRGKEKSNGCCASGCSWSGTVDVMRDMNYLKERAIHKIEDAFGQWGIICFCYPYHVIGGAIALFVFGCGGFLTSPTWVDGSEDLYSLPVTQARTEGEIFLNLFGAYASRASYINFTGDVGENLLTYEKFFYLEKFESILRGQEPDDDGKFWSVGPSAYVQTSNGKYTVEDYYSNSDKHWDTIDSAGLPDGRCRARLQGINMECLCLKNESSGKCAVQSVLEMGPMNTPEYSNWKKAATMAFKSDLPLPPPPDVPLELVKVNGFVFSPDGTGFVPALTLGGTIDKACRRSMPRILMSKIDPIMYPPIGSPKVHAYARCISHVESFMSIYQLQDNEINFHANMLLEEIWIQRINKFKTQWRAKWGLVISQNPMRARDDELRKSTSESSDILFVFLTFTILVVYSVSFNFNIDMFKAKVYTAIAGVGAAIMGMVSGVGFVCYMNIAMVPTTLIVPFLSMGIGVDDMFVIINSYALSYPIRDPKKRIEVTMKDCGLSITITTLTNLIAFSIGSFSPYMSIKNFCLFSAGALGFGYIFALTITVAILSLEAYRETELSTCCCFPMKALQNHEPKTCNMIATLNSQDNPANVVKRRVHRAFMEDPYWRQKCLALGITQDYEVMTPNLKPNLFSSELWATIPRQTHDSHRLALIAEGNLETGSQDILLSTPMRRDPKAEMPLETPFDPNASLEMTSVQTTDQYEQYNMYGTLNEPKTEVISEEDVTPEYDERNYDYHQYDENDPMQHARDKQMHWFKEDQRHGATPPSPLTLVDTAEDYQAKNTWDGVPMGKLPQEEDVFDYRTPVVSSPASRRNAGHSSRLSRRSKSSRHWARRFSMSTDFNQEEWDEIRDDLLTEPKGNVGRGFREFLLRQYALILLRPWMKVIVCIVFMCFAGVSTYGMINVEQGLDLEDLAPDFSYLKKFDDLTKTYFTTYDVPTSLFFDKDIPWHTKEAQKSLAMLMVELGRLEALALVVDPMTRILNDTSYFTQNNRYDEQYFHMAIKSAVSTTYSQFFSDFLFEGDQVASWKATIFPNAMHTSKQRAKFMIETRDLLANWANDPSIVLKRPLCTIEWQQIEIKTPIATLEPLTTEYPGATTPEPDFLITYERIVKKRKRLAPGESCPADDEEEDLIFLGKHSEPSSTSLEEIEALVPLHSYAWNYMMIFYESDLEITSAVVVSMTVAVVAMLFVSLLLLSEITMGLVVVLMLFLIDLNLFGFMYYWNVKLNMISMINLVISVGFAVDYAAHMCHTYSHCKSKTPDMKATEMLVLMGGAVFNGGSSTLIGILMLGFSTSYIFRVFFKLFLLVVVFGVSHGMILLPVVLTMVDQLQNMGKNKDETEDVVNIKDGETLSLNGPANY